MAEPVTDQQLDAWLADNQPPPPWARSRPYLRQILQEQRDAHAASDARKAAAAPQQTSEIALLRRRVRDLEIIVGKPERPGKPGKGGAITDAVGMALAEIRKDIEQKSRAELLKRDIELAHLRGELDNVRAKLAELENTQVKFCGLYDHKVTYAPNSLVTRQGSLWRSRRETEEMPGFGCADWVLAVKRGRDRERARPDPGVSKP